MAHKWHTSAHSRVHMLRCTFDAVFSTSYKASAHQVAPWIITGVSLSASTHQIATPLLRLQQRTRLLSVEERVDGNFRRRPLEVRDGASDVKVIQLGEDGHAVVQE
eukprot:6794654-Prymnesium_polylepis.1